MASGIKMCGYRSAREIGSDGSEMIGEACGQSSFGLANIQHLAALADNGIDQISRGAGKWRGYVMTNPIGTGNFNCVKNMRTCFASGTFAFSSARWRLRITCTNNAVSNVAFTTICGDRRIGEDVLSRFMFAKQFKVLNNNVAYGDVTGMVGNHKRNAISYRYPLRLYIYNI